MRGSSRVFVVRTSLVMSHLHALMCLFWLSSTTPLSSLSWPSSLSYHPVLPPAHQLHLPRCGGQIPCAISLMRTLAPCRVRPSHRLWAQRLPHLGGYWTIHPGILGREWVTELRERWRHHRQGALFTSSPRSEKMMRAVDEPITLKTKVCRPVSRHPSVMIERRDPWWNRLTHTFQTSEKFRATVQKVSKSGFFWTTDGADSCWLSSRDSKTRVPSRLWQKKHSKVEWSFIESQKEEICRAHQGDEVDEINNFFMHSYWNKIGIFVELMGKASVKWKNWSDFKAQHSIQFQGENWSKIETLSLNSQAR